MIFILFPLFIFQTFAFGQKSKNKKSKVEEKGPKVFEVVGDSLLTDSVVYYKTEVGFAMPDLSPKFNGRWSINVMRRQARAIPDSLNESYIEFYGDTLFSAFVGCSKLSGKYTIKGPTIKFKVLDTVITTCDSNEVQSWFRKLIQERVSYFGIDEKILQLKDVAYNIVFDCSRRKEEESKNATSQNN
jgi:hypothetical protein